MKMFKKLMALTLAVLMLLTSMTVVSFADDAAAETFTPAVKWLYMKPVSASGSERPADSPYFDENFTYETWRNGSIVINPTTPSTSNSLTLRNVALPANENVKSLPSDYHFARIGLTSSWNKKTGVSYEPYLTDTDHPYYEVWVDLPGHSASNDVAFNIEIDGDDGTYKATLPKVSENNSGWHRQMVKVGNIKLSNKKFNRITLTLPLGVKYYAKSDTKPEGYNTAWTSGDYLNIGGVMLVQLENKPDELLPLERSINVIEPMADIYANWNAFALGGGKLLASPQFTYGTDLVDAYGLDEEIGTDYKNYERSNGTKYNTSGVLKSGDTYKYTRRANVYKGIWTESEAQAGWYKIYVDKMAHQNTDTVPYFTLQVLHAGGTSEYIIDRNHPETKTTWNASRHYVGTFKMRNGGTDQLRIYWPVLADGEETGWRADLGSIICVPVTEEEAAKAMAEDELTKEETLYLMPEYSADFKADFTDNGESAIVEYYANGGYHQLALDATKGKTSITTNAYTNASDDLKKALAFNEGVIDFDLYWAYTDGVLDKTREKAPYFSVILGKSATASAEIRIYKDKAELIEGEKVTDLYVPTDYLHFMTDNITKPRTLATGASWHSNCRIEITDVANKKLANSAEATTRAKSKDGADKKTKLLKVYTNTAGGDQDLCIGAAYIPADSILYTDEAENALSDNYISFVNYAGEEPNAELNNIVKVRNLSIAVPDSNITSGDLVEEVETEFSNAGAYKLNAYIPFKYSNTMLGKRTAKEYAYAVAAYKGDTLADVDVFEKLIKNGDKVTIDLSVDTTDVDKVKLFKWKNFDKMVPYVAAEIVE